LELGEAAMQIGSARQCGASRGLFSGVKMVPWGHGWPPRCERTIQIERSGPLWTRVGMAGLGRGVELGL